MQPTVLLTHSALNQLTGLRVSVCVCVFSVCFLLSSFASPLPAPWLFRVSGWLSLLYVSYLLTSDYTECSPVVKRCGLPSHSSSPVSCPVLSCPQIPHLISRIHTWAGTPMWILHPLVLLEPQWQTHIVLFVSCLHTLKQRLHTHTHSQTEGMWSMRFKHSVYPGRSLGVYPLHC